MLRNLGQPVVGRWVVGISCACTDAVSYTHLDVYKRQVSVCEDTYLFLQWRFCRARYQTVSYTHLLVMRQFFLTNKTGRKAI